MRGFYIYSYLLLRYSLKFDSVKVLLAGTSSLKGGSVLKTGILGNCVFARFSKNIKHLTFAGCQSEIPLNSSQLLSIPYESEVLLPICYQIFDDVLGRCQGVFYKKRVFYLGYLTGATSGGCLTVKN